MEVPQSYLLDDIKWYRQAVKLFMDSLSHPNPKVGGPIRREGKFIGSTVYDLLLDSMAFEGLIIRSGGNDGEKDWVEYSTRKI